MGDVELRGGWGVVRRGFGEGRMRAVLWVGGLVGGKRGLVLPFWCWLFGRMRWLMGGDARVVEGV